jgi:hypothetical protein
MTPKTITARLDALRRKADAEDERDRMLALGADQDSSDLHVRALLALADRGITDPSPDEYIQAYEAERLADEPTEPAIPRLDPDELHEAAVKLLASRGVVSPDYDEYAAAIQEVTSNG